MKIVKTLKDHTILYDAECPMCKAYTNAFTATGMLDANSRAPYQQMPDFACPLIDHQRAVNEIALINKTTGQVTYGIESLFKIIANAFPIFRPLFNCKPFITAMRKVYAFISYNRKVIIPAPTTDTHTLQPAFRLRYRLAYLLFTAIVVGYILTLYARTLTGILPNGSPYREYAIVAGQLAFQGLIITTYASKKTWDYLGNMMTISLAGSLLLLPVLIIHPSKNIAAGYFLTVAALMLLEHIRRTKLLNLGWLPTITWIAYRTLILIFLQLRHHLF
jgi:predicted DCC family thiol-disulfide oxidoreductase YuxK